MKLKRLSIKNIRSYEDQEMVFPDGSLLLAGDIGSGKTSILMAIEYALFGLQPGQRGSALLRNDCNEASVELEIVSSGAPVIIERRLKRTEKNITNEYSAITIDGSKTESSTTEIKTKVIQLLGYPPEFIKKNNLLYRYTVYTPQEQMKQIVSEDSETRLNVIRHIFGFDKYKRIKENLSVLLNSGG
jgi:exonuclease SbcC